MFLENHNTARLRFRKLTLADKEPMMEFFNDPLAMEFLFMDTSPEDFAETWFKRQLNRYRNNTGGLLGIELLETGELVGQCGLLYQWVDGIPKWEIGYHILRRFWGNGFATEAARAYRDFCFEDEMAETVISLIHPDNHRSQAVAHRNGMTPWKETEWRGHPVIVFRIRRVEWEQRLVTAKI